jgi:hypothetical protein
MGRLYCNGNYLGILQYDNTKNYKTIFLAKNLESLVDFFKIKEGDLLEVNDWMRLNHETKKFKEITNSKMSYEQFKEEVLNKISVFYPSEDEFLLKDLNFRTLKDFKRDYNK